MSGKEDGQSVARPPRGHQGQCPVEGQDPKGPEGVFQIQRDPTHQPSREGLFLGTGEESLTGLHPGSGTEDKPFNLARLLQRTWELHPTR